MVSQSSVRYKEVLSLEMFIFYGNDCVLVCGDGDTVGDALSDFPLSDVTVNRGFLLGHVAAEIGCYGTVKGEKFEYF